MGLVYDSLAQWVEQQIFNLWVEGSSPSRVTNLIKKGDFI